MAESAGRFKRMARGTAVWFSDSVGWEAAELFLKGRGKMEPFNLLPVMVAVAAPVALVEFFSAENNCFFFVCVRVCLVQGDGPSTD